MFYETSTYFQAFALKVIDKEFFVRNELRICLGKRH